MFDDLMPGRGHPPGSLRRPGAPAPLASIGRLRAMARQLDAATAPGDGGEDADWREDLVAASRRLGPDDRWRLAGLLCAVREEGDRR